MARRGFAACTGYSSGSPEREGTTHFADVAHLGWLSEEGKCLPD
jgi:hypothetical protein